MPTTEIAVFPLKAGANPGDPDSNAGKVTKSTFDTLRTVDGMQQIQFGMQVENPTMLQLMINWDSKKHHDNFAASDAYGPFLQTFMSICDGEPLMFCHADFKPEGSLSKVLSAPVTEFVVVYFEGGPKDDYLQNVSKFAQAVDQAQPEGYLGCSYGATYEELQKEEVKGKAVVISVGWQRQDRKRPRASGFHRGSTSTVEHLQHLPSGGQDLDQTGPPPTGIDDIKYLAETARLLRPSYTFANTTTADFIIQPTLIRAPQTTSSPLPSPFQSLFAHRNCFLRVWLGSRATPSIANLTSESRSRRPMLTSLPRFHTLSAWPSHHTIYGGLGLLHGKAWPSMNGYSYDGGFNADDVGQNAQYGMPDPMTMAEDGMGGDGMGGDSMGGDGMAGDLVGGQSLDEILNGNAKSSRKQSLPRQYSQNMGRMSSDMRSVSMMSFGTGSPAGPMGEYFEPSAGSSMMPGASSNNPQQRVPQKASHSANVSRRQSAENGLALNTNFGNTPQTFGNMMGSNSAFASPHASGGMGMGMASPYVDSNMGMSVEGLGGQMMDDPMSMNAYNQPQYSTSAMASPMHPSAQPNAPNPGARGATNDIASRGGSTPFGSNVLNSGGNSVRNALSRSHSLHLNDGQSPAAQATPPMSQSGPAPVPQPPVNQGFRGQPQYPAPGSRQDVGMANSNFNGVNGPLPVNAANYNPNNQGFPWEAPEGGWPSTMINKPHMQSSYK
ncbi:hypothetical protein D0866_03740, partial [Hortaea werneckii]